ncbi:Arm DNA-binding domain-containing protein [Flagellimonas oceanensis]|uniref:Arm DNA-binding domain-containing protein n=1 Tax=Flagellimonas oceanensis TaxID=2499163 RepID=UPI001F24464C|nr:Arm DNA-binding domain-containing protein [Allomuricauda oceanensis]
MKAKNTFAVVFFTRKSRSVPNQLSIYVRITVDGKRSEISLKRNVASKNWDNARNRVKGSSQLDRAVNVYHLRRMKVSSANQVHEIDSFWC